MKDWLLTVGAFFFIGMFFIALCGLFHLVCIMLGIIEQKYGLYPALTFLIFIASITIGTSFYLSDKVYLSDKEGR